MGKHFWIFTHNFTNSGAPLVMAAIARELAAAGWREQLRIISWGGLHDQRHSNLQHQLIAEGIKCQVLDPSQLPPNVNPGDRLLLNTVALPDQVIQHALAWLNLGRLRRLDWYAHESDPQFWIINQKTRSLIAAALGSSGLQMRVPSINVRCTYQKWLNYDGDSLDIHCPRIQPSQLFSSNQLFSEKDFETLRIVLVGAAGFGNKGHLWLLQLLESVLSKVPNQSPGMRPLKVQLLGLETGLYAGLAREVIRRYQSLLRDFFSWEEAASRDAVLGQMRESNIVINCSYKEAFSCVSVEGMALGLIPMRTRTGGFEEQIVPYEVGFDLGKPSHTINSWQTQLLIDLRDRCKTSDSFLLGMSNHCKEFSKKFFLSDYRSWLIK